MLQNGAKIISLVPSWTETFIECGVQVIGRTRYCIHPHDRVQKIPIVGGTKSLKLEEILLLKPDFVVMDREENKKEMADQLQQNGIQIIASHVDSITTAADFLKDLSEKWQNEKLQRLSERYYAVLTKRSELSLQSFIKKSISEAGDTASVKNLIEQLQSGVQYVIWKGPFMTIGPETFISAVLDLFSIKLANISVNTSATEEASQTSAQSPKHLATEEAALKNPKYPTLEESVLKNYFCLFSTEPYPFARQIHSLREAGFKCVLVDGELVSWYGIRNLRFLESCLNDKR